MRSIKYIADALVVALVVLTLIFLSGCKSGAAVEYVEVPLEKVVNVYTGRIDTIETHTEHIVRQVGDTIYDTRVEWRNRVKEVHDTMEMLVEVPVKVPVRVEVERDFSWVERMMLGSFWWILGGFACCLLWIGRKPVWAAVKALLK